MRSAAESYDGSTVGIVLSGTRDDGAAGLAAIKARGGRALAQDPAEALYDGMPRSAMASVSLDAVLPVADIARWLAAAARGAPPDDAPTSADPPPPVSFQGDGRSDEARASPAPTAAVASTRSARTDHAAEVLRRPRVLAGELRRRARA